MKYFFIVFIVIAIISCSTVERFSDKSVVKTDENYSENITKRKGDTVVYKVPKIVYKDTTIYSYNHEGTILKTIYDKQGNISQIECHASAIEEINKLYTKIQDEKRDIDSEKEKDVMKQFIPYIILAIVVLVAFAMVLFSLVMYLKFK